ncbi:MAG: SAM-dependent methyltransferase [Lachnospiraceae bacterium]|jgi:tRNA (adenine22-N1)-methyltransferase|nr:SAM-dependent methyltransferase [Lachnospiraceae bacterium]MDE6989498.1 class I SAM-dependent methyltransferase [Lachnospiraceae bacterium]MDE6999212.1 class I SAM-dependent methyltransferase [Lachnospiraceae bacterium]
MLLSDRMRAVAGLVQPCKSIADIGCDHGYVAMELVRSKVCRHVIAMDVNSGPLDRARHNIADFCMQDYIETRLSDGVSALREGEAEGIICAGMGGKLVISILEQGKKLIGEMKQVILQPQSELSEVRGYLREKGYLVEKEDIIYEDGKYYPMMRALPGAFGKLEWQISGNLEQKCRKSGVYINGIPASRQPFNISETSKGEAQRLTRVQDTYGPCLLSMAHPVLKRYLLWQKANFEKIRNDLLSQERLTDRQQLRVQELDEKLSDIVFCLYCYFRYR